MARSADIRFRDTLISEGGVVVSSTTPWCDASHEALSLLTCITSCGIAAQSGLAKIECWQLSPDHFQIGAVLDGLNSLAAKYTK
jgi:hypothetical protein